MFSLPKLVHAIVFLVAITEMASASHLHRYHRYHRDALNNPALQRRGDPEPLTINLDLLAKYICTPCSDVTKRQEAAPLAIPTNDLPTLYTELQTLKAETINRMTAAGLTPSKRSRFALISRTETPKEVPVPAKEFDILSSYVCPTNCIAKRETRIKVNTSITTNININVPSEQLQSVLNAINQALKQVEALLRSLGLPIPEGSFPTIPNPGAPAQPAPVEPQEPVQPAPDAPAPEAPAPEVPQEPAQPAPEVPQEPAPPAPAPTPEPTPAPEAPRPTITTRSTSTNTRTVTATNGIVTTVIVSESAAPAPTQAPPPGGNEGQVCSPTVTVNSTTTVFVEGGEATTVA